MIEPKTPVVELESRLGRVGSIQKWDPWDARLSTEHAKWFVAKIASLSYGNEEAKNYKKLFDFVVEKQHLSCLEFVPALVNGKRHLPVASLRHGMGALHNPDAWGEMFANYGRTAGEASVFLVEAPIFVARQWMRHRAFSYLEMSRRYTLESKVPATFYGEDVDLETGPNDIVSAHYLKCVALYDRLLSMQEPPELARRVLPVGMMTKFWVGGYNRDWDGFLKLRDDAHAQPEIQVFAKKIREMIYG